MSNTLWLVKIILAGLFLISVIVFQEMSFPMHISGLYLLYNSLIREQSPHEASNIVLGLPSIKSNILFLIFWMKNFDMFYKSIYNMYKKENDLFFILDLFNRWNIFNSFNIFFG